MQPEYFHTTLSTNNIFARNNRSIYISLKTEVSPKLCVLRFCCEQLWPWLMRRVTKTTAYNKLLTNANDHVVATAFLPLSKMYTLPISQESQIPHRDVSWEWNITIIDISIYRYSSSVQCACSVCVHACVCACSACMWKLQADLCCNMESIIMTPGILSIHRTSITKTSTPADQWSSKNQTKTRPTFLYHRWPSIGTQEVSIGAQEDLIACPRTTLYGGRVHWDGSHLHRGASWRWHWSAHATMWAVQ